MVEVSGRADTVDHLRTIVCDQLGLTEDCITTAAILTGAANVGAGPLDMDELAMTVEEEFDIEVGDEELDRVRTFGDAVSLIERHSEA